MQLPAAKRVRWSLVRVLTPTDRLRDLPRKRQAPSGAAFARPGATPPPRFPPPPRLPQARAYRHDLPSGGFTSMYSLDTTVGSSPGRKCGKRYHCAGCNKVLWVGSDTGGHFRKCFDCREADAERERKGKRRCLDCERSAWGRKHRCRSCHREHVKERNRLRNFRTVLRDPEMVRECKRRYRNSAKGREKQRIYRARYRARHAERITAKKTANATAIRASNRAAQRKRYWKNPEAARERSRLNYAKCREKKRANERASREEQAIHSGSPTLAAVAVVRD